MNRKDLENLVMEQYLVNLIHLRPEMKSLKNVNEIELFIKNTFTEEQLFEAYQNASVSIIGDFVSLVEKK